MTHHAVRRPSVVAGPGRPPGGERHAGLSRAAGRPPPARRRRRRVLPRQAARPTPTPGWRSCIPVSGCGPVPAWCSTAAGISSRPRSSASTSTAVVSSACIAPAGESVMDAVRAVGHVPLPPYVKRDDTPADRERYQTVYARHEGSIAAPTAGLHFTPAILAALDARGVARTCADAPRRLRNLPARSCGDRGGSPDGGRGVRGLSGGGRGAQPRPARGPPDHRGRHHDDANARVPGARTPTAPCAAQAGETALFIHPGHRFQLVGGLITNFHLPRSSLLMLVSAFAGRDRVLAAYRDAIAHGYRFYSYGDAMLIL